jgi:type VI secretion system secreted protein Hcp
MAVDVFLKVGDIKGESKDAKHEGEIDVLSWSWGVTQTGSLGAGGGAGAGKAEFHDLFFVTRVSKASPKLILAVAGGTHIKTAVLTGTRGGGSGKAVDYLVYRLSDVIVTSVQHGAAEGPPTEQVSLRYAKFQVSYRRQSPSGALEPAVEAGWDLKTNKKI